MKIQGDSTATTIAMEASCLRCHKEFLAYDAERTCPKCRHLHAPLPLKNPLHPRKRRSHCDQKSLTDRQESLTACVREGLSDKETAQRLGLSPGTVRGYMSRLRRILGVSQRTGLTLLGAHVGDDGVYADGGDG